MSLIVLGFGGLGYFLVCAMRTSYMGRQLVVVSRRGVGDTHGHVGTVEASQPGMIDMETEGTSGCWPRDEGVRSVDSPENIAPW